MLETTVTFVDLETTGLDADLHEIIEIAAIKTSVSNGEVFIITNCSFTITPKLPVDPFVANINGFNDHVPALAVSLDYALGRIFDLMRGAYHAGSNPAFDAAFLKKAADRFHWMYPTLSSYFLIDVTSMFGLPLVLNGAIEEMNQENLAKHYEIDGGGHRALADARQCLEIFAKVNSLKIDWDFYDENSCF